MQIISIIFLTTLVMLRLIMFINVTFNQLTDLNKKANTEAAVHWYPLK